MGYFANGTEGEMYQARWCERCRNFGADKLSKETDTWGCPIWDVHMHYAYDHAGEPRDSPVNRILDNLIPREGVHNLECSMFTPIPGHEIDGQLELVPWKESHA